MFRTEFNAVFLSVCLGIVLIKVAIEALPYQLLHVSLVDAKVAEVFGAKDDPVQKVKRYQLECIEETRVDAEVITNIKKGYWNIPTSDTQQVKEWALCALMKNGLMTKQGVYKIDVALAKVPPKERNDVEKLIDSCLSTKAIPAPDIAFNFIKCFQKTKSNYTVSIFE